MDKPRYEQVSDGAVNDGVFGVRFLCVNDHNGNLAADLLNKYDVTYIEQAATIATLTRERDELAEALREYRLNHDALSFRRGFAKDCACVVCDKARLALSRVAR